MSREDAIKLMKEGKKLTHSYFSFDEWITMKKSFIEGWMIHLEDGVICTPEEFWKHRTEKEWDINWKILI